MSLGQSPLDTYRRDLSEREKKNLYLAVAAGCLATIEDNLDERPHSKRRRSFREARAVLMKDIAPRIPRVEEHNMQLFTDSIRVSEKVLNEITTDRPDKRNALDLPMFEAIA